MSRSRFAALLSAVVASIAAFLTLKPWGLFGTLAGAAIFSFVHTLVSHWSTKGIDRTIAAVRRRAGEQRSPGEHEQPPSPGETDASDSPPSEPYLPGWTRWLSVGLACVALAIGIYSLLLGSSPERVIVRERVIEREVAAAAELTTVSAGPDAPSSQPDPTTTTAADPTSSTTDDSTPPADSSSTTTTGSGDVVESEGTAGGTAAEGSAGKSGVTDTTGDGATDQTLPPSTQTAP